MGKSYLTDAGTLDRQAVLDKTYQHFVMEGNEPPEKCVYHEETTGRCCVIGLFDDGKHLRRYNDQLLGMLLKSRPHVAESVFGLSKDEHWPDLVFLQELQEAHDNALLDYGTEGDFKELFIHNINALAEEYHLSV